MDGSLELTNVNTSQVLRILVKQKSGLQICHINAQSLTKKIDEFRHMFIDSGVDVICVSETWFVPDLSDSLIECRGYNVFRSDRVGHAGGVAIYINNKISAKILCKQGPDSAIEYLFLTITINRRKMLLGCIYRPNRNIDYSDLTSLITDISLTYTDVILAGDFNCDILRESSLADSMLSLDLNIVNHQLPTHFTKTRNTLLDLFFVDSTDKILLYDQLTAPGYSKHDLIFLTYDFNPDYDNYDTFYRDFKNIDLEKLHTDISILDWTSIHYMLSVNSQLAQLQSNIDYLYCEHVPIKRKTVKRTDNSWFNPEIKLGIIKRNEAFKKFKRYKTESHFNMYKSLRSNVTKLIYSAKTAFYSSKFNNALCSKQKWQVIKSIGIGKKTRNSLVDMDVNEVNKKFLQLVVPDPTPTLNLTSAPYNYTVPSFSFCCVSPCDVLESIHKIKSNATGLDDMNPKFLRIILPRIIMHVTHIFNTAITTSTFPEQWKEAKIIPIPKANSAEYRPISILPTLSKAFETLVAKQINSFLTEHTLLNNNQSGFRTNRSCTTAMIKIVEDIRERIDDGNVTFLTLLDYTKAFDSVDHRILIAKLRESYNFSDSAVRLLSSYLLNRSQAVVAEGKMSSFAYVKCGVPQGSVLGPILFSIYINDLPIVLSDCKVHMYADDVQLYVSRPLNRIDECINVTNRELEKISAWATKNRLCLNPTKSKCLIIYKNKKKINETILRRVEISNTPISYIEKTTNLGFIINSTLSWDDHVSKAVGKTYGILRALNITKQFIPVSIRMQIAKAYLVPVLTYGIEAFGNCGYENRQKLSVCFNNIARYIFRLRRSDRISAFSYKIFDMTLFKWIDYKMLTFLHKIILTRQPQYLYEKLRFTNSARTNNIITIRYRTLNSERHFFVNVIRIWNHLPHHMKTIRNLSQFKTQLGAHLTLD
ncbi:uncharacterized protein LOC121403754 isoform X1 [Drosophila obscura]|uniref:uncharacterized protein LOC121403754 isoform X1 n=1 Tax=Drosophila obscura TaxID=7282 RepID=UPI000B9FCE90|nr:uncharacterized protein LOC121403754 isoform X1 [Drosophila obscura]